MSEMPEQLRQALPHNPRLWARNFLYHPNDNRRYDFYGDDPEDDDGYLWYLVDDDGPMNPDRWGDINVLLFARGCLKTWTTSTLLAWALDCYPSLEAVATAPVDDQRDEIIDRFKIKAEQSRLASRRVKKSNRHQKFENSATARDGSTYTAYSHLKSRSAWDGGDKLRGLHAQVGVIDESQDVDEGTFSTFLEAIDQSVPQVDYFPTVFIIGTPKMANTFFNRLWSMSDQKTWDSDADAGPDRKRDEGAWVQQADSEEFLPTEAKRERRQLQERVEELEEEREGATESRAAEIDETIAAIEDQIESLQGFTVRGWHIDQFNSPLHDDTKIEFKRSTYSEQKFKNEVEAKFHTPENNLLSDVDLYGDEDRRGAFRDTRFPTEPQYSETKTYLGVDWGGGSSEGAAGTAVMVAEETPDGGLSVLNATILDSDMSHSEEREFIDSWMQRYDVDLGIVDEGHGDTDREELQDEYGYSQKGEQTIYGCWYGNVKDKEEIKWNRFNDQKRFFTCAKTFMVEKMCEDVKAGRVEIPIGSVSFDGRQSLGKQLVQQLTTPYIEKTTLSGGKTKKTVENDGQNDDLFDALTYVWIAANKLGSRRTLRQIGGAKRKGYTS